MASPSSVRTSARTTVAAGVYHTLFIDKEIKDIVQSKANNRVTCDTDPSFYLRYLDIFVGKPSVEEEYVKLGASPAYALRSWCTCTWTRPG